MRILVVYAHPVAESFTAAVRDAALAGLKQAGHDLRVTDLYAEDFDPRLSRQDRLNYQNPALSIAPVREHVDNVRWAEGLIFVFPTWNQSLPAILKGWFDRVWLPEVAFHLKKGGLRQFTPLLTNIRLLAGITTAGSPGWLTWVSGDIVRRTLLRGVRAQCHPRCRALWLAHYRIESSTRESRARFIEKVESRMAAL